MVVLPAPAKMRSSDAARPDASLVGGEQPTGRPAARLCAGQLPRANIGPCEPCICPASAATR
jgi:hypothetical protein